MTFVNNPSGRWISTRKVTFDNRLTQRAPDGWDPARFLEFVLSLGSFPFLNLFSLAAGNASH
jgi:hypothetical protein